MANANSAVLSLCLLLAVAGALASTATTETAARRRLQRMPRASDDDTASPVVPRTYAPPAPGPMVPLPPAAVACWRSILASENCVDDILQSLARLEVHVSKVCCSVLERIGDKCIVDAFSNFPFNPLFPPLVRRVCSFAT